MIVMPADNTGIIVGWLAGRFPGRIGHLYGPRKGRNPTGPFSFIPYALDNGAFAGGEDWQESDWLRLLKWAKMSGQRPIWMIVPDVVGDRIRTIRKWNIYYPRLAEYGWPLAFAVQDGMTVDDVPCGASVIFVGGTTAWKWRTVRMWAENFPRVHVGRVNTYRRLWDAHEAGAESCDGTGWMRGDQKQRRDLIAYLEESAAGRRKHEQLEMIA